MKGKITRAHLKEAINYIFNQKVKNRICIIKYDNAITHEHKRFLEEESVEKDFAKYLNEKRKSPGFFHTYYISIDAIIEGERAMGTIYSSNSLEDIKSWINNKYKEWKQKRLKQQFI